jgi:hypothetical protein
MFVFLFACAHPAPVAPNYVRLIKATATGPDATEPLWVFRIDRAMAAELTDEASVDRCESELQSGATACEVTFGGGCLQLLRVGTEADYQLHLMPWSCRNAEAASLAWTVASGLQVKGRVPIATHAHAMVPPSP